MSAIKQQLGIVPENQYDFQLIEFNLDFSFYPISTGDTGISIPVPSKLLRRRLYGFMSVRWSQPAVFIGASLIGLLNKSVVFDIPLDNGYQIASANTGFSVQQCGASAPVSMFDSQGPFQEFNFGAGFVAPHTGISPGETLANVNFQPMLKFTNSCSDLLYRPSPNGIQVDHYSINNIYSKFNILSGKSIISEIDEVRLNIDSIPMLNYSGSYFYCVIACESFAVNKKQKQKTT